MKILLVEDEKHLADGLRFNLEAEGYEAEVAETGEAALAHVVQQHFDLVVLDVMLPGINGFQVVSEMRAMQHFEPVLMLTARGRAEDILHGFSAGADDYLAKPFELAILMARIKGLLRRGQWLRTPVQDRFEFQGKVIDFEAMEVHVGERILQLTLMEANFLRYLIKHRGKERIPQINSGGCVGRA